MTEKQQVDTKDLKIQALLERVSNLTANYENQVADLRVSLTVSENKREELESFANSKDTDVLEEYQNLTNDNS